MVPEDQFTKSLEIRQAAKIAFAKVDSSRRVRAALLRKAVPLRGPYCAGDLVCFHRRDRWHGPCRVIGKEGRSTYWLIHGGVPLVVPEASMRPASSTEVFAKHLLELRPSRRRVRDAMRSPEIENVDEIPFGEDLEMASFEEEQNQQSYVDVPLDLPVEGSPETGAFPMPAALAPVPEAVPVLDEMMEEVPYPEQPESEMTPAPTTPQSEEPPVGPIPHALQQPHDSNTELTQALRRSADGLDGHPLHPSLRPPPGLAVTAGDSGERDRSRSPPPREPASIPIPDDGDVGLFVNVNTDARERKHLHCFLAKRYAKKNKVKAGAGREIFYDKCTPEVQEALQTTRLKEWNNWKQFQAVRVIPPEEADAFVNNNPNMEILPTRWLEVDKAEVGEEPKLKSRIIVRGDLERNNNLRTDSPTTSQLYFNLILSFSACSGYPLGAGDISAAFLQGAGIARVLAFKLPRGGVPDDEVKEGSLLLAEKAVYGTRDAPRGFWKGLHETLIASGLRAVDLEQSAYYLPGPEGEVAGLLGAHVDDLLWCGGKAMDNVMLAVQEKYKFGSVSGNEFRFCGRVINQTPDGILVTCPNVMDRVKPIYLSPLRKKDRAAQAEPHEIAQLRSVVGSLAWLSRVCRPDLAFGVNQLQSVQQAARVQDLVQANKMLSLSLATKDKGIFYKAKPFKFEDAILLSVNDASHAASFEEIKPGFVGGHRSQSGRLLFLASPQFREEGKGHVHLLEWHSTTIRRVCRSTMQAETLSLQLGSEEAEHVRQVMYALKNYQNFGGPSKNYVAALDHMVCLWITDCRSLSDHMLTPGMSEVSDKRLAIDLTALRQEAWRSVGESVGNPTYSDSLPENRTTYVRWVATASMVADALTKEMKTVQLDQATSTGWLHFIYEGFPPVEI